MEKIDPMVFLFGRIEDQIRKLIAEKYMEYKPGLAEVFDDLCGQMNINLMSKKKEGVPANHEIFWASTIQHECYENRFDAFIIHFQVDLDLEEFSFRISNKFDSFHNN